MNEKNYINDAFTKEGENTNLEVNQLKATCITSTNNKFELDSEGNLTVKSIQTENNQVPGTIDVLNSVYPVGSIYMSVNAVNPDTLFGGTWLQLKDKFLLGCGDTFLNGSVGGEINHKLTELELPNVTGSFGIHGGENGSALWAPAGVFKDSAVKEGVYATFNDITKHNAVSSMMDAKFSFGNNQEHNNMPPYLAVYIWKRID